MSCVCGQPGGIRPPCHSIHKCALQVLPHPPGFLLGDQGGGPAPVGHTQRNQASPTAGGPAQSLTSEIRLTPLCQEEPNAQTKKSMVVEPTHLGGVLQRMPPQHKHAHHTGPPHYMSLEKTVVNPPALLPSSCCSRRVSSFASISSGAWPGSDTFTTCTHTVRRPAQYVISLPHLY